MKPEYLEKYKALHANPWPEVNEMIKKCNIQNYSIYYRGGYLFSYFEYVGDNYEEDMKKKWLQTPKHRNGGKRQIPTRASGICKTREEWWAN